MFCESGSGLFQGRHFGLVTLHGKESLIAPVLAQRWQARLSHSAAFDTDSLGTFSGEVERRLTPVECALRKARMALDLTGADYGLGSEGSFGTAPWGFGVLNQELVACVPAVGDWFVVGCHAAPVAVAECFYNNAHALEAFWQNLPEHQGVMLIGGGVTAKGLGTRAEVLARVAASFGEQVPPDVRIAYDLRAHQSPLRRVNIKKAVANLLERLDSRCNQCGRPGFWPDRSESGLPCSDCGTPTNSLRARIARCEGCGHQQTYPVEQHLADPATCPFCNP